MEIRMTQISDCAKAQPFGREIWLAPGAASNFSLCSSTHIHRCISAYSFELLSVSIKHFDYLTTWKTNYNNIDVLVIYLKVSVKYLYTFVVSLSYR